MALAHLASIMPILFSDRPAQLEGAVNPTACRRDHGIARPALPDLSDQQIGNLIPSERHDIYIENGDETKLNRMRFPIDAPESAGRDPLSKLARQHDRGGRCQHDPRRRRKMEGVAHRHRPEVRRCGIDDAVPMIGKRSASIGGCIMRSGWIGGSRAVRHDEKDREKRCHGNSACHRQDESAGVFLRMDVEVAIASIDTRPQCTDDAPAEVDAC